MRGIAELGTSDVAALTAEKNEAVLTAALDQKDIAEAQDFELSPEDRIGLRPGRAIRWRRRFRSGHG